MGKGKDGKGVKGKDGKGAEKTKAQLKRERDAQIWKQAVPPAADVNIFEEWQRAFHRLTDERVGRWRNITQVLHNPDPTEFNRAEGIMVRNAFKWDLYFRHDESSFNYTIMYERLVEHPMVCNVEHLPAKQEGQWKTDAHGICKFFDDDRLPPGDIDE